MRLAICSVILVAAALFAAAPAGAQDARRGESLAAQACASCHGADGRSQMEGTPSLAGQPADFITIQMIMFREGLRDVPVMNTFAANLPDRDIEDLAAHFAALPPGPAEDRRALDAGLYAAGQALSGPHHCGVCHLPDYRGRNQIPRLTGQREEFIARTLSEYRSGRRIGSDTNMNAVASGLSNADIIALAHYLSQRD